ncbi:probable protein phosphatase 2C 68 [Oryza brachyantha]|nr:probable protein phosphatase 2C 68 [Oryza brachyantha]
MSMAEVCCDSAVVVVGAEAEARARARAGRRRRAGVEGAGRWKAGTGAAVAEEAGAVTRKRRAGGGEAGVVVVAKRHGAASVAGRRREMEDAVSLHEAFAAPAAEEGVGVGAARCDFYGVFDGHGCSHVAEACRERMHELVAEEMGAGAAAARETASWEGAMERSFARMDAEAVAGRRAESGSCRCEAHKCDHVGSTAVVAVVEEGRVVVANCGDSRAVLCRDGAPVQLSSDHKPDRPDELERIEGAGGRVIFWEGARVLGVLAMSRSIGDAYLKPYVSAVPEVTVTDRSDGDECLILASDGLWDVVSNEAACEVAQACLRRGRQRWCAEAAALLTKLALARRSSDNISVVVVDLRRTNTL